MYLFGKFVKGNICALICLLQCAIMYHKNRLLFYLKTGGLLKQPLHSISLPSSEDNIVTIAWWGDDTLSPCQSYLVLEKAQSDNYSMCIWVSNVSNAATGALVCLTRKRKRFLVLANRCTCGMETNVKPVRCIRYFFVPDSIFCESGLTICIYSEIKVNQLNRRRPE